MIKVQYIKDALSLCWEFRKIRKIIPDIKQVFENFNNSEDSRISLEKILEEIKRNSVADDLLKINQSYGLVLRAEENAQKNGWGSAGLEAIKETGVKIKTLGEENIPRVGGGLYVANHPYGYLDGIILIGSLGSLFEKKGEKIKVVATQNLKFIKGIEEALNFVYPKSGLNSNLSSLRNSLEFINSGGNLAIYPSGVPSGPGLEEYPWKNGIAPFISRSSYVIPIWFSGPDHGEIYNFLAKYKKTENLRKILSVREAWDKKGETIILNIGKPIRSGELMKIKDSKERIQYLRGKAEALKIY